MNEKIKIPSSFTRPHVVSNLYDFFSAEHCGRYFEELMFKGRKKKSHTGLERHEGE